MPRPMKGRNVCGLPKAYQFGPRDHPINDDSVVQMTIDEYESIRLIDLEGLTQEQCAQQMMIARTTVQAIYAEARKKVADTIINAKRLMIQGGNFHLCNGERPFCKQHGCRRNFNRSNQQDDV